MSLLLTMSTSSRIASPADVLSFFGRHLVALCVTYHLAVDDERVKEPRFAAYNGTLIRVKDAICFLTAGHVLAELEETLKDGRIEVLEAVLVDTLGASRVTEHPIPFDLRNARFHYIDYREEGLDFGVIILDWYYVRLLGKNGVVVLGEENWIHQSEVQFDGYAMLGLPQEFTSPRVSDGEGVVSPTMFWIKRLDFPPDDSKPTRYPRFVGQINSKLQLMSVEGMSGGPIFGFRFGAETRYWIVALQSSWLPERRIVFGCPLPILAPLLTKWAE
jgi:hypothetical protein